MDIYCHTACGSIDWSDGIKHQQVVLKGQRRSGYVGTQIERAAQCQWRGKAGTKS